MGFWDLLKTQCQYKFALLKTPTFMVRHQKFPEYLIRVWLGAVLCFGTGSLCAQTDSTAQQNSKPEAWTLQDCIDYARENNLQVKSAQLNLQSAQNDLKTAKASRWPSLSFSSSQGFTNGYRMNENGVRATQSQYTGTYQIASNVVLYNGGKINQTIKQQSLLQESSKLLVEKAKNDIEISVTAAFLEVLYAKESLQTDLQVLENSRSQLERAQARYQAGSIRQSELAQIQAQYETDRYNCVVAQSTLENRKLDLKQLLELEPEETMEIAALGNEMADLMRALPSVASVYDQAGRNMPEIRASEIRLQASAHAQKAARSQMIPSLTLNASVGTGYYTSAQFAFLNQLNNNLNENVNIGISIPIYQRRQAKSSIEAAKINTQQAMLDLQNEQKQLLKEIEQAYQDAYSAQNRFEAAQSKHAASELSYRLVQEEYEAGAKTMVDVLTEKSVYLAAVEEMLKAKYQTALSLRLLDFYTQRENASF